MRTLRPSAIAFAVVRQTVRLVPGTELWEDFCVPSDYNTFNTDVYLPVATGDQK